MRDDHVMRYRRLHVMHEVGATKAPEQTGCPAMGVPHVKLGLQSPILII